MKLTRLRGSCNDSKTCPTIYASDRDTVVVQGWRISDSVSHVLAGHLLDGDFAVEIPESLVAEALAGHPRSELSPTPHETVVVRGRVVLDDEALAQLGPLPAGEALVEISLESIAEVVRAS